MVYAKPSRAAMMGRRSESHRVTVYFIMLEALRALVR